MVVSGSSATLKCSQITLLKSARSVSPVSAWITFHMRKLQRINGTELWHKVPQDAASAHSCQTNVVDIMSFKLSAP
jgi:hypothetical protein